MCMCVATGKGLVSDFSVTVKHRAHTDKTFVLLSAHTRLQSTIHTHTHTHTLLLIHIHLTLQTHHS